MLEKSLSHLSDIFRGFTVSAVEKEVCALPPESESGECGYYLAGKIDCILASPNETEFAIVDYKTSSVPKNLKVKGQEPNKKEKTIDFQLPLYLYLLENNVNESERLAVTIAQFYSIKNAVETPFLGQTENGKANKIIDEEVNLAKAEMLKYARRFYEEVANEQFAVTALNQSRTVCTAKGEFDNCIDYQALCRRYFTVSGE